MEKIIKKILKQGDKKILIVPKNSSFDFGDYAEIKKIDLKELIKK